MSDKYFEGMADNWLSNILESDTNKAAKRMLVLFAKEIERDCRHKAAGMAQALANDIHNMRHIENK